MGISSQYPIWLGRTFAFAYDLMLKAPHDNDLMLTGPHKNDFDIKIKTFVQQLVSGLPPPGFLLPEVGGQKQTTIVDWVHL